MGRARSTTSSVVLALAAISAVAAGIPGPAAGAELEAVVRLEPDTVAPGGIVAMTLVVTGEGGLRRLPAEPSFVLENLEQVSEVPTRSEQFQWVNGEASRSLSLRWILRAQAAGEARVKAIRIRSGDTVIELPDQAVTVDPNAPRARDIVPPASPFSRYLEDPFARQSRPSDDPRDDGRNPSRAPKVFVRSVIEPAEVFVGQQAIYSLYLYTQTDIASVDPGELPDFRGFWARDLPRAGSGSAGGSGGSGGSAGGERVRPETVEEEGERYARVPLVQKALFPLEAREYEIPAIDLRLSARVPSAGLGGLFQQVVAIDRRAEAIRLVARPLPPMPPASGDFSGAVGSMRLEAKLEPERLEVGQAATLTLSLAGEGNLQGVRDPQLPALGDVRIFPPQQEAIDEVRGKSVRGRRTWKWVLVPGQAGIWTVPPIEMNYFDPKQQRYETTASTPLTFVAQEPVTSVAAVAPETPAPAATAEEAAAAPRPRGWDFWLPWALAIGFGSALALVLLRRSSRATAPMLAPIAPITPVAPMAPGIPMATAPATGASASATPAKGTPMPPPSPAHLLGTSRAHELPAALERELIAALDAASQEARPRAFANAIDEVLRRWIDARWDIPPSTATARWLDLLADRGAHEEATLLRRLAEDLRYLRFAPELGSHESVRVTVLANAKRLIQT